MKTSLRSLLPFALALAVGSPAPAQNATPNGGTAAGQLLPQLKIRPLVLQGVRLPGVPGTVRSTFAVAVNDAGDWTARVLTISPPGEYLVRGDGAILAVGDPVAVPAGATIARFKSSALGPTGEGSFHFGLDGSPAGDDGIYLEDELLLLEGNVSSSTGLTWMQFLGPPRALGPKALVLGGVLGTPGGSTRSVAARLDLDDAGGIASEAVLASTAPAPAGQTPPTLVPVHANEAGDLLYTLTYRISGSPNDYEVYLNGAVVARTGDPAPVPGRVWTRPIGTDLNAAGSYLVAGDLEDPSNSETLIVKDGAKFVQRGDSFPAIAPTSVTNVDDGAKIDDGGHVYWWAQRDGAFGPVGLYRDLEVLMEVGRTRVGGKMLSSISRSFEVSDEGRYVLFSGSLGDGLLGTVDGLFLATLGEAPGATSLDLGPAAAGHSFALASGFRDVPGTSGWRLESLGVLDGAGRATLEAGPLQGRPGAVRTAFVFGPDGVRAIELDG